jgi:hypothetical protein
MVVPAFTVAGGIRGAMSKNRLPSIKVMMRGKGHRKGGAHSGSLRILNSPRVMTNMIKVVGYEDRDTIKLTEGQVCHLHRSTTLTRFASWRGTDKQYRHQPM